MPGLVGFVRNETGEQECVLRLQEMEAMVAHSDCCNKDKLFIDNHLCATRVHTNITQPATQPFRDGNLHVWLDGEFFNRQELGGRAGRQAQSDPECMSALYRQFGDFSFLRHIDGIYTAVIFDSATQKLHLISDRYGLRHLHWAIHRDALVWSSELKAMLALSGFEAKVDPLGVEEFINVGWFLNNRTMLEGVELLPAATVLTWDLRSRTHRSQRYWWWDQVGPLGDRVDEDEIAEEMGRLLVSAVERRCHPGERIGLTLSGGLDSRALLAAMPMRGSAIHAVTIGTKGCDDIRIAAMAARAKGAIHHVVDMNQHNWLASRPEAVWWTDGRKDLLHMAIVAGYQAGQGKFDIVLDGAGGGLLKGDDLYYAGEPVSYLRNKFACNIKPGSGLAERIYDYYETLGSNYALYVDSRMRSFTMSGPKLALFFHMEYRIPLMDNALQEFVFSLPEKLRRRGVICEKMLAATFPELFTRIPWQATGAPIGRKDVWSSGRKLMKRAMRRLKHEISSRFGINYGGTHQFTAYPTWLRQEPAQSYFGGLIESSAALYSSHIERQNVLTAWKQHLSGKDRSMEIGRYITLELWLQHFYEIKSRLIANKLEQ